MAKQCGVEDCDKPFMARDMCSMHYYRWHYKNKGPCSFEGCRNNAVCFDLCYGHNRQRRAGEELRPLKSNRRSDCSVPGCDRLVSAQRLCGKHYYRWRANGDPEVTIIAAKGSGCTAKDGYRVLVIDGKQVPEHRWIMEQHLGRSLLKDETVHHVNGVRDDNRIENLELWSSSHPRGQRVQDKVEWAVMMLRRYAPERIVGGDVT